MIDGYDMAPWMQYLIIFAEALLVVGLAVIFFFLERKTPFKKLKWIYRQIIIGVVFGGAAIFGTELGINIGSSVINVRDAAPLVAGLIFGGPAGMIAAVIGAVERIFYTFFFHDYAGYYSMVACVIATTFSGLYAWALRKWFFEEKTPNFLFGFATAVIMEVLHFIILYLGHIRDPQSVLTIIKAIAIQMALGNGFGVGMACLVISLLEYFTNKERKTIVRARTINSRIQLGLLILILSTALMSTSFVVIIQRNNAYEEATFALAVNESDATDLIVKESDEMTESLSRLVASFYMDELGLYGNDKLDWVKKQLPVTEVSLVAQTDTDDHKAGEIIYSTDRSDIGFNLNDTNLEEYYLFVHQDTVGYGSYVQEFSYCQRHAEKRKLVTYSLKELHNLDYYLLVTLNTHDYYELIDINKEISDFAKHRRIYLTGYFVVFNSNGELITDGSEYDGIQFGLTFNEIKNAPQFQRLEGVIYGDNSYYMIEETETYYIISVMPVTDVTDTRDMMIIIYTFMLAVIYASVFFVTYILIKRLIIQNIRKINNTLSLIMAGDLTQRVNVDSSIEFIDLSNDINVTVDILKQFIKEAEERIDTELAFARTIQSSSLPSVFPAFPGINEFDIYATMNTAREVGGDFYDFYLIDADHLVFLVADVSGKGIPASMFMMESKALLKNSSMSLKNVDQVFNRVNQALSQGNEANMFVTCWMGILDLNTGIVQFANAGHNAPIIYSSKDKKWRYLSEEKDLVLGGFETYKYRAQSIQLEPGDKIFLYTDGVTESTNKNNELYGEARLLAYLNKLKTFDQYKLLPGIQKDIDKFVAGADQFDDITMLIFDFKELRK